VTDRESIDQIEFRWQPGKDLSPIASSFTNTGARDRWFARLAGLVRPATPNADLGVPSRSVVYWTFSDGHAAVIWRQYEMNAITLHDDTPRLPLVARAIVAQRNSLRPDTAIAFCRANAEAELGPPPGQVETGADLPPISISRLRTVAVQAMGEIDEISCQEPGLAPLIAARMRTQDTPISVQLPGK